MISLLLALSLAQAPAPETNTVEVNLPVVKIGILNSNNNLFTSECCEKWISGFSKKDIYQMDTSGDKVSEKKIGEVSCLHTENGWVVAKCIFTQKIPKGYVLRLHSSPVRYAVNDELRFNIFEARIIRFLLVDELKGSRWD